MNLRAYLHMGEGWVGEEGGRRVGDWEKVTKNGGRECGRECGRDLHVGGKGGWEPVR